MDSTISRAMLALFAIALVGNSGCNSDKVICGDVVCAGGEVCMNSRCVALCSNDGQCGIGESCDDQGACIPSNCMIDGEKVGNRALDPLNPCRICDPSIEIESYTNVADGNACDDGKFCTTPGTCYAGQCDLGPPPCPPTLDFCSESAEQCTCTKDSCNDGLFCTGEEYCTATGECSSGTPVVCSAPTAVCNDDAAACVQCATHEQCAAPNPVCVNNICTPCLSCQCPLGQHNGGDGVCVDLSSCSTGYLLVFTDGDADGYGAGLAETCIPWTGGNIESGFSLDGSDCDDADATTFQLLSGYRELDEDGYSTSLIEVCTDDSLPAGWSQIPAPVPFAAREPQRAGSSGPGGGRSRWRSENRALSIDGRYARCTPTENSGCTVLEIGAYGLEIPSDATITGVAVHIVKRISQFDTLGPTDQMVQLTTDAGPVGNNLADPLTPWPSQSTETVYGGPTELWGLTDLTPEVVNAASFGVAISVMTANLKDESEAQVDGIWVEVFTEGNFDCDDNNDLTWLEQLLFVDADTDGRTVGQPELVCTDGTTPDGLSVTSLGEDCDDQDRRVFPEQPAFFAKPSTNWGFDYNCNGDATEAAPLTTFTSCTNIKGCVFCGAGVSESAPAAPCGETNFLTRCTGICGACALSSLQTPTRCH